MKATSKNQTRLLALLSVGAALVAAEILFRTLLFTDFSFMQRFKNSDYYFKADEDDYWKLALLFSSKFNPPQKPHPLLGWIGWEERFSRESFIHSEAKNIQGRRPVLLYGDSFAACTTKGAHCFDDVLNADSKFNRAHFLLNYGVGGYAVDQIYLLMSHSISNYEKPIVFFSLMTGDLMRSLLSIRGGQKPRFKLNSSGNLELDSPAIDPNPEHFFSENKPFVISYLYSLLRLKLSPKHSPETLKRARDINAAILTQAEKELKEKGIDHYFLIFSSLSDFGEDIDDSIALSWQESFLKDFFERNAISYLDTKSIILDDMRKTGRKPRDYFLEDMHPSILQNKLVSERLKAKVLHTTL